MFEVDVAVQQTSLESDCYLYCSGVLLFGGGGHASVELRLSSILFYTAMVRLSPNAPPGPSLRTNEMTRRCMYEDYKTSNLKMLLRLCAERDLWSNDGALSVQRETTGASCGLRFCSISVVGS